MEESLKHFGILGMRWGIRKEKSNLKPSYRDKQEKRYLERGYSPKDAATLAKRKANLRTGFLIAGGVTAAVGVALVARYASVELRDVKIKEGSKVFHIARGEIKDLDPGRNLFVTINQFDRFAYQARLGNPKNLPRIERTFETIRDLKIPSTRKAERFYKEYMAENGAAVREVLTSVGIRDHSYAMFNSVAPYFSEGDGWVRHFSNNKAGVTVWKDFQEFVIKKGYQGLLDEHDRSVVKGFNVEQPTILFDAATRIREISQKHLPNARGSFSLIPTIREIPKPSNSIPAAIFGGAIALSSIDRFRAVESYRRVYPNSKQTDLEIEKLFNSGRLPSKVYTELSVFG